MGHRALVAYERADGRYDLHYSHWGADRLRLERELSPGTPFGRASVPEARTDGRPRTTVRPDPVATDLSLEGALARVDFLHHEAFYVVSVDYDVTAYLVLSFGVPTGRGIVEGDATVGRGALVSAPGRDPHGVGYLRGWFDGAREALGELVDAGHLPEHDAVPLLVDALRRFACDRELILDPARDSGGS